VVREPRQFPITVQGIEEELTTYLAQNMLPELVALSDGVRVKLVKKVTISSISLKGEGYRVAGDGLLIMDIYYSGVTLSFLAVLNGDQSRNKKWSILYPRWTIDALRARSVDLSFGLLLPKAN
jgi:hypothetical protein